MTERKRGGSPPTPKSDPRVVRAQAAFDAGQSVTAVARAVRVSTVTLYAWRKRGLVSFAGERPRRRPAPVVIPGRTATAPADAARHRRGPTLKGLAEETIQDGRKVCPVCGEETASRYCPNNHDILLDAIVDGDGPEGLSDDEGEDFD